MTARLRARNPSKMAISDWPEDDRPREKLLRLGPAALTDSELLAIFLRVGMKGKSAVDLAREILERFDHLAGIWNASPEEFCAVPGLGKAKYVQFHAAIELTRRVLEAQLRGGSSLTSPAAVRDFLRLTIQSRPIEVFLAIFLDAQHRTLAVEELFSGTLTQTSVYPREVVKRALQRNAAAVIFAHNHPSGVAEPSQADEILTRSLKDALALIDVRVLDHFIVAGSSAPYSFAEHGRL
jgi:DNA repair protein RadC